MKDQRPLLIGSLVLNGALLVCVMILALRQPPESPQDELQRSITDSFMQNFQEALDDPDFGESPQDPNLAAPETLDAGPLSQ